MPEGLVKQELLLLPQTIALTRFRSFLSAKAISGTQVVLGKGHPLTSCAFLAVPSIAGQRAGQVSFSSQYQQLIATKAEV